MSFFEYLKSIKRIRVSTESNKIVIEVELDSEKHAQQAKQAIKQYLALLKAYNSKIEIQ